MQQEKHDKYKIVGLRLNSEDGERTAFSIIDDVSVKDYVENQCGSAWHFV